MSDRVVRLSTRVLVLLVASVVLEVIAQLLPPHLSAIRDTESALAVGPCRAFEITSLCLRGALVFVLLRAASLALPIKYTSSLGNALLFGVAVAKFVIAFVPADLGARPETVHGVIHAALAFLSFFAASIGEILVARALLPLAWFPALALLELAQVTLAWSVLITVTACIGLSYWGLLERSESVLLLGWIAMFAGAMLRHARGRLPSNTRSVEES
ncbi:MAG TPA: DUF998 domain-containing protein [Kofleriaceae bacterium]|jgi:hypothetical protein